MRNRAIALWIATLSGCSLAPFEPTIGGDGGRRDAAPRADARVADGAPSDGPSTGSEGDCTNGSDDDGDGDVDCADSDCVDYVCVAAAPVDWMGPAYPSTTGCDAAGAETLVEGGRRMTSPDVTCGSCSCSGPTGTGCNATVTANSDTTCLGTTTAINVPDDGCANGTAMAVSNVTTTFNGSCSVSGADPPMITSAPPVAFAERLWMCWNGAGGGCGAGMACVAAPPDGAPTCVTRDGDVTCPDDRPHRRVLITTTEDMRYCSGCSCSASGSCGGTLTAHAGTGCGSPIGTVSLSTATCTALPATAGSFYYNDSVSGTSCNASGGNPRGCIAPAETATVCCTSDAGPSCPTGPGPAMLHITPSVSGANDYCIDSTEVTEAQYAEFLAAAVDPSTQSDPCTDNSTFIPEWWSPDASTADRPVVGVDWCDARAYCEWAGKRLCGLMDGTSVGDESDEEDPDRSEWAHACTSRGSDNPSCPSPEPPDDIRSDPCCRTDDGAWQLAGNADEWVGTCRPAGDMRDCFAHKGDDCEWADRNQRWEEEEDLSFRCCADPL